ncbi:cell division protein [Pseudoduganella sp. SL102]|uniref:cell division protein ZipA C-terminal FtsZ-binding domain-containing protein n=1 Tax=Pseudoduganella sp. SL102 TaxID=2995154 RepID=UPI00248CB66F|nr:cell division protein ZipA C-terminal FtsZ-binding domain-containing protein [Pseudoduganella sp. SL102]WBS00756.1 cell division protein [Pseudoduganella sp. SL102]
MTDFQTSLIAAAGVFVAGVFIYNKWQEHKAKKSVERAFASEHDDVLMRAEEPAFDAGGIDPALDAAHAPLHTHDDAPAHAPAHAQAHAPVTARAEPSFTLGDLPMVDAGSGAYGKPPHEDTVAPSVVADDVQRLEPSVDVPAGVAEPLAPAAPAAPVTPAAPVAAAPASTAAPAPAPAPAPPTPTPAPAPAATPAIEPAVPVRSADAAVPPSELATALVDPLIDCLLPLEMAAPLRGEKLLPVLQKLRLVGNKPVHYVGLAVSGDWEPIRYGTVYTKLQGGVQLASRTTALNELEYSELVTRLRTMSDEIGAEPQIPDMMEVMAEARNLHRFVAAHDAQLGVNLAANGAPWDVTTLVGALEKQGFDLRPDGRFVMSDGEGGQLFTLSTNVSPAEETTGRLTLLLDVPCVAPARDGFGAMIACAKSLVQRLDAIIVDDYNQPLSDASIAEIAGQVKEFYADMEASDIPAGSTRALRLFN